ncbi:MAG: nucleotidyltransferase domain-containing protein [Chloroflexota bacterium]
MNKKSDNPGRQIKAHLASRDTINDKLASVILRVIKVAQPERIILFGSAARGELGPNSDFDLLVVKSGVHRRHLAQKIYQNMIGIAYPVDIIVVTPEDIERYRHAAGLVLEPALREGIVVYEREATSS